MLALATGQFYYVLYKNPGSDNTRLWTWESANVTPYAPGSTVALGTSDLANITLISPPSLATVALPYLFQWTPRPATPSDSYFLVLFIPGTSYYATTPLLGYVGGVNIPCLPPGFYPNVQYGWYMRVKDLNGGYGTSRYSDRVTFSNSPPCPSGALDMAPRSTGRRDDLPFPPRREQ